MDALFKTLYTNLFTINQPYSDSQEYRRLVLVNVCLYLTTITLTIFATLHTFIFENGRPQVAAIDLIGAVATAYAIFDLRRTGNIDRAAMIGTISLFAFFLMFFHLNQNQSFGLIWSVFLPIFAISVNGAKRGLQVTVIFYLILLIMAYDAIGVWQEGSWDLKSFLRLAFASMILTFIIYINEIAVAKAKLQEQQALDELQKLSCMDELTQIANRREINSMLHSEIQRAQRYKHPLTLVLFDIDDFKQINDRYGHLVGDDILQRITCLAKQNIRQTDSIGRWGGEEFCLILPEQDADSAHVLCEKLRKLIESTQYDSVKLPVTCSFGIAVCDCQKLCDPSCSDQFIQNADSALYQAKKEGKNKIVAYDPETSFTFEQRLLSL